MGQKSKSKVYGKMQGSAKRMVSSREPGIEAALVYRDEWEPGWEEVRGWDVEQRRGLNLILVKRKKSGRADVGCKVMEGGKLQGAQLSAAAASCRCQIWGCRCRAGTVSAVGRHAGTWVLRYFGRSGSRALGS